MAVNEVLYRRVLDKCEKYYDLCEEMVSEIFDEGNKIGWNSIELLQKFHLAIQSWREATMALIWVQDVTDVKLDPDEKKEPGSVTNFLSLRDRKSPNGET